MDATDVERPTWLKDARINIVDPCFKAAPDTPAIVFQKENDDNLQTLSYKNLENYINRIANAFKENGLQQGDTIGIDMAMNIEAVAIYLAGIKTGMQVVTVADSFSPDEIKVRFNIAPPKLVFTHYLLRGGKKLPLYNKVLDIRRNYIYIKPKI